MLQIIFHFLLLRRLKREIKKIRIVKNVISYQKLIKDRETDREKDREKDRERDRELETEREREREKQRERERQREK
jgi:hypothetical protein